MPRSHATPSGTLSLVATPIGNLEDITLRALRTLREADVVLAEDTRHTRKLTTHHGIGARLRAFHGHSGREAIARCLADLEAGRHLALVSDAGSPLISDPGAALVEAAVAAGHRVEPIPGPSAVIAALSVAGLAIDSFRFVGFLPRGGKGRRMILDEIAGERGATVLFEAPTRLADTLGSLRERLGGERQACVCRELTKLHESQVRGTLDALLECFQEGTRGEITLVVAGHGATKAAAPDAEEVDARIDALLEAGVSPRDAARQLQEETGLPKRELYARVQARTNDAR